MNQVKWPAVAVSAFVFGVLGGLLSLAHSMLAPLGKKTGAAPG